MSRNTAPRTLHRKLTQTAGNWTFRPFVSSPLGRLNRFPAYLVKTHMIISRRILLNTARLAKFQCGARGAVFRHTRYVTVFATGKMCLLDALVRSILPES